MCLDIILRRRKITSNTFFKIILFAFIALVSACATSPVYYPEETLTPQFTEKDQTDMSFTLNGVERGFGANLAYSITNETFLAGKYSFSDQSNCKSCTTNKRDYVEIAIGKYNFPSVLKADQILVGLGRGKSKSLETLPFPRKDIPIATSQYYRGFFQLSWTNRTKYIERIFTIRSSNLYLDEYVETYDGGLKVVPNGRNWAMFIEPAGTVKVNLGNFYLKSQLGISIPMTPDNKFNHDWVWLVGGIGYRI